MLWHEQLQHQDTARLWSHTRGSGGPQAVVGAGSDHEALELLTAGLSIAQTLGQSRQHTWQSTLCRDCSRAATGSSPGPCRCEALADASGSQQTEEGGPQPCPRARGAPPHPGSPQTHLKRGSKAIRDTGKLPACPPAPRAAWVTAAATSITRNSRSKPHQLPAAPLACILAVALS